MQDAAIDHQPQLPAPVIRFALAAAVALGLAAVVVVATSASHTAVRHMSAQFQETSRYVTLPPVEIVGRRDLAAGAPETATRSAAAAMTSCVQPS